MTQRNRATKWDYYQTFDLVHALGKTRLLQEDVFEEEWLENK
jgi:hypothetical protein